MTRVLLLSLSYCNDNGHWNFVPSFVRVLFILWWKKEGFFNPLQESYSSVLLNALSSLGEVRLGGLECTHLEGPYLRKVIYGDKIHTTVTPH